MHLGCETCRSSQLVAKMGWGSSSPNLKGGTLLQPTFTFLLRFIYSLSLTDWFFHFLYHFCTKYYPWNLIQIILLQPWAPKLIPIAMKHQNIFLLLKNKSNGKKDKFGVSSEKTLPGKALLLTARCLAFLHYQLECFPISLIKLTKYNHLENSIGKWAPLSKMKPP